MRTLLVLVTLASTGCIAAPLATAPTSNPAIQVDLLFEHDGCRVYRFMDGGTYRYFARCAGTGQAATMLPDRCGKSSRECGAVPTY